MRRPLVAAMIALLALSACGGFRDSRLNPLNWFGRSEARATDVAARAAFERPADPRPLVDQVTAMMIERVPGGAILRATGLPPTQGHWDAELVEVRRGAEDDPATLTFDFRLAPPPWRTNTGPPRSREVVVATFLTDNKLSGIRVIVVRGARSERVVRR
jgi:hypothetical protein